MSTPTRRGRAKFYDTSDTQPIVGVARFQVRSFVDGAAIKFEDGEPLAIARAGEALEGPWEHIQLSGVAVLRIWPDLGGPLAGVGQEQIGTSTPEKADVVQAPAGAATPALAANAARRSFGLQNQGLKPVAVALAAGMNGAGGAGSLVVAILAPCVAAYDGTGGTFGLAGYTGPVYIWGVGGASDVSVGAM